MTDTLAPEAHPTEGTFAGFAGPRLVPVTLPDIPLDFEAAAQYVYRVNEANGWYEDERTWLEDLALLHSEASEALEAYRSWGLEDMTVLQCCDKKYGGDLIAHDIDTEHLCKPEGVGSEIADVFIRWLDVVNRRDLDVDDYTDIYSIDGTFGDGIGSLQQWISGMFNPLTGEESTDSVSGVLASIRLICYVFDIDLLAEYKRKMRFNETRGYRHGGKRL